MRMIRISLLAVLIVFAHSIHGQDFEIISNEVTQVYNSLNDALFINDSTGYAVGGYGFGTGVIIKTTDSGNSWVRTNVNHNLFSITFLNDTIGYAVGESSTIMKTVDGGDNWSYLNVDIIAPSFQCRTVAFLNPDTGFVGTANGPGYAFLTTYNGGETWVNADYGTVYGRARLQKVNDSTIYSLPYDNKFYKTTDYGESWDDVFLPENAGSARDMHFFNKDTGIVAIREFSSSCGSNYYLAKTYNGGESWTNQYYPCTNFSAFEFSNNDVGFSIGTYFSDSGVRTFWQTVDSGNTWVELEYPVGENHFEVSCMATCITCVNQDTCYMPTNYGTIIKMTNATGGLVSKVASNTSSSNKLQISPNPNNGNFTINKGKLEENAIISIFSLDGKKVFEDKRGDLGQLHQISVPNLQSGIYILTIETEKNSYYGKFSKL